MRGPALLIALLSIAASGCGRACRKEEQPQPIAPAPEKGDAAKPELLPLEIWGTVAIAYSDESLSQVILLTIDAKGISAPKTIAKSTDSELRNPLISTDRKSVVYTRLISADGGTPSEALHVVGIDGSDDRELTRCAHECGVAGIGPDDRIWYVDREPSLFGTIHSIARSGGKPKLWPGNPKDWLGCHVELALSRDATKMLVAVDDSLGWPTCVGSELQGLYVVPLADPSLGKTLGKRITSFSTSPKGMNVQIDDASFDDKGEHLLFTVREGDPEVRWSCNLDGTDARHDPIEGWKLVVERDETARLVAVPPRGVVHPNVQIYGPMLEYQGHDRRGP